MNSQNSDRYQTLQEVVNEFGYVKVPVETNYGEMQLPFDYDSFAAFLLDEDQGCCYFPNGKLYLFSAEEFLKKKH